jgi:hypothetical protein
LRDLRRQFHRMNQVIEHTSVGIYRKHAGRGNNGSMSVEMYSRTRPLLVNSIEMKVVRIYLTRGEVYSSCSDR